LTFKERLANNANVSFQTDDELDLPYLAGFEWDKEESWTELVVHLAKNSSAPMEKKKKNK